MSLAFNILVMAPPLLTAIILHEVAHGWVAEKLGDPTARALGRITLNPIKHIDPVMTLLLPGLLIASGSPIIFGGAKPVPINPGYFKNPRKGMVWVALAGPAVNIVLASICYLLVMALDKANADVVSHSAIVLLVGAWLVYGVVINLVLALFNLFPVPPLDGGRIAVGILPLSLARPLAKLERWGLLIVFLLLYSGVIDAYLGPIIKFVITRLGG